MTLPLLLTDDQRWPHWWPLLLGPAAIGMTYVAHAAGWQWFLEKRHHEIPAYGLLIIAIAAFLVRYARQRRTWLLLLAALAVIFLLREWKTYLRMPALGIEKTSAWVFVLLAAWAIWGWLWSNRWNAAMHAGRLWLWLCCTGWTYLLSQLMSRRAMKFLPLEGAPHRLHVPMEESIENVAHIMLIVCAFADRFVRRPPDR